MYTFCHVVSAWVLTNTCPIFLQRNKVESQASTIRSLERCLCSLGPCEVGGSSDSVTDAAGGITPPADEGDPMKTHNAI